MSVTVIKSLLDRDTALQLTDWIADDEAFVDGSVTASGAAKTVKNSLQLPATNPKAKQLGGVILSALTMSDEFKAKAFPQAVLPMRFCRYDVGMGYGAHLDLPLMGAPSGPPLRTDLSITVFLSSPHHYEGGDLFIDTECGVRRFRGGAGDAVIYPSSMLHGVEPVTQGSRLVAISWIESMVRDPAHRKLLGDLSEVAAAMEKKEDSDSVRLRQVYYNLVRRWAR